MSYEPQDQYDYTRVSTCCTTTMLADIDRCSLCGEWDEGQPAFEDEEIIERPSQRIFSDFQPTATQIVVFLILAFVALGLGIDTAMKGDLAAMRFEGNGASGR